MSRYIGIMYKSKSIYPWKARLQMYHSFVQSHLNYCSLVWGFACKSSIGALFSKQKKGLRAVISGFINYKYTDGEIAGPQNHFFRLQNSRNTWDHNLAYTNIYLFIRKVRHFPSSLPSSIVETIAKNSPVPGSTHETYADGLKLYNNFLYFKSIFYKSPLLVSVTTSNLEENLSPASLTAMKLKAYKNIIKHVMLTIQGSGVAAAWEPSNLPLYNIHYTWP